MLSVLVTRLLLFISITFFIGICKRKKKESTRDLIYEVPVLQLQGAGSDDTVWHTADSAAECQMQSDDHMSHKAVQLVTAHCNNKQC